MKNDGYSGDHIDNMNYLRANNIIDLTPSTTYQKCTHSWFYCDIIMEWVLLPHTKNFFWSDGNQKKDQHWNYVELVLIVSIRESLFDE